MNITIHYAKYFAVALLFAAFAVVNVAAESTVATQALQRLTNDLGLQLKLTYRHDLATHRERYAELAAALAAWNRSPRTDADYALMSDWLRTAIRNSMPGDGKPLPPPPTFSVPQPVVAELPALKPTQSAPSSVVEKPQSDSTSVVTKSVPPSVTRDAEQSAPPVATAKPTPPAQSTRPAPRDFWSKHPAARPLELDNPFRDDPLPRQLKPTRQPNPEQVAVVEPPVNPTSEEPTVRTAMRLPVMETSEVAVNLPELSSRIGGYNQALRRVEAAIIASNNPNARELAKLLAELDQLADQRDFIDLYVVGLSPQEGSAIPKLDRADAALSLLEEKVIARLESPAATASSAERDILLALVRKLAELQQGIPETP